MNNELILASNDPKSSLEAVSVKGGVVSKTGSGRFSCAGWTACVNF